MLHSELSEEVGGTCEQNEYRKNPKTYFTLSAKGIMYNEEIGGKYVTMKGHLT
jgi:hypothetical protein